MTLEPNEHFYAGAPELDEVQILLGANAFQPMNLYQTGAVDIAPVSVFSLDRALDPASDLYRRPAGNRISSRSNIWRCETMSNR